MAKERSSLLEATVVLAIATGLLYAWGYSYHEGYLASLGVPVRSVSIHPANIMLYGYFSLWILGTLGVMLLVVVAAAFTDINWTRLFALIGVKRPRFGSPQLWRLGSGIVILGAISVVGILVSGNLGKATGERFLSGECPVVKIMLQLPPNSKRRLQAGCFIVLNEGSYWLREIDGDGRLTSVTYIVSEKYVLAVQMLGTTAALPMAKANKALQATR